MTTATRTRPLPAHGTPARYKGTKNGSRPPCPCEPCTAAYKRHMKAYHAATLHGKARVDITPVTAKLRAWVEAGYSQRQIADTTGLYSGDISRLLNPTQPTTHRRIAAKILNAKNPPGIPAYATTDAAGTVRRGRALHYIGYPFDRISTELGMCPSDLSGLLKDPPATVRQTTAAAMAAVYEGLRWKPGPSNRARIAARRFGWHSPLAWDDIDNPDEQPEADPDAGRRRYRSDPIDPARVARLTAEQLTAQQIADRLGCTPRTVVRARRRAEQMETAA